MSTAYKNRRKLHKWELNNGWVLRRINSWEIQAELNRKLPVSRGYKNRRKNFWRDGRNPSKYVPYVDEAVMAALVLNGHCRACGFPPGSHYTGCPNRKVDDDRVSIGTNRAKKMLMEWVNGK